MGYADAAQLLGDIQTRGAPTSRITWWGTGYLAVRAWLIERDEQTFRPTCVAVVNAIAPPATSELADLLFVTRRQRGRVALVVDGMDQAGCEYVVFKAARERYQASGIHTDIVIPVIANSGEGICSGPDRIDWYSGPTLEQWLRETALRVST